jgi:hypothetical protein
LLFPRVFTLDGRFGDGSVPLHCVADGHAALREASATTTDFAPGNGGSPENGMHEKRASRGASAP